MKYLGLIIVIALGCLTAFADDGANPQQTAGTPDIRSEPSFVASCPDKYLTYLDKSEGGPGAYCACPDDQISYLDKSEGGPGAYCSEVQPARTFDSTLIDS